MPEDSGRKPHQLVADGDYTNHASVQAAAVHGVRIFTDPGRTAGSQASATRRDATVPFKPVPFLMMWSGISFVAPRRYHAFSRPLAGLPKCFPHPALASERAGLFSFAPAALFPDISWKYLLQVRFRALFASGNAVWWRGTEYVLSGAW